jgi:threonine dehydrogenase-like Zn-dependent dehydrogenase
MKAITVAPGKPGTARLEDVPEPDPREGSVLVEAVAVGVCGTDVEIAKGKYGWPPVGTVIAKALEQVQAVGQRAFWQPKTVLVTGAGPIGLLAALGAKLMGMEVHVLDRVETGVKPELVRALGATYHAGSVIWTSRSSRT